MSSMPCFQEPSQPDENKKPISVEVRLINSAEQALAIAHGKIAATQRYSLPRRRWWPIRVGAIALAVGTSIGSVLAIGEGLPLAILAAWGSWWKLLLVAFAHLAVGTALAVLTFALLRSSRGTSKKAD